MATITIDPKESIKLSAWHNTDSYQTVSCEVIDEWRWGNVYELVVKDSEGKFWATVYKEQSGDNYYNFMEDEDEVEFYQVEPVEVVKVTYRRIKD
jgi:hypothetical protein